MPNGGHELRRAEAARSIELLRQFGPALPMPHAKTDKTSRTEIEKAMRLRAVVLAGDYEDN
jgi:hypothetical protein